MLFDVFRVVLRPNDKDLMARESVQPVCQVNIVKRGEEGGLEGEERKSTQINLSGPLPLISKLISPSKCTFTRGVAPRMDR